MEDEAQVLEGGRLGQHMLPNMPRARSDAVEDHNFCLGGADGEVKGLAEAVHAIQKGPHEQTHRASSSLKQIGILSPDGTKARAVKNVMKFITNSLIVAKAAPPEMAREAGSNKSALLNGQ